jgi:hydrogenase expression/formation protein HypD
MDRNATLHSSPFSDPALCRGLLERLRRELDRPLRFMEVCGTHTVAIYRSGLRTLLPEGIEHLSGPGCPVCVTHEREIAACLALAEKDGIMVATFGDLMRVPGPGGKSLQQSSAEGARVEVVYSPLEALALARRQPERNVVFLGVGFETTAPAVAATVQMARKEKIGNFTVLALHKRVPPALRALLGEHGPERTDGSIDAFLLPGHVATVLGIAPFRFLAEVHSRPGVVSGFDPADILQSLLLLLEMRKKETPAILNQYRRAVSDNGNPRAREILCAVFEPADALWRGIGLLPQSGLVIREEYAAFDARKRFLPDLPEATANRGCQCGKVLTGQIAPGSCPLFGTVCTPVTPVGPCMVSAEGSCAARFLYAVEA